MDTRAPSPEPGIIGMDQPNTSSAPAAILWITFVLALGLTVFLFMASRSVANAVSAKESTKQDIESELSSPAYTSVAEKATAFKEAFDILNTLATSRVSKRELLTELFQNFTNDVNIGNLQIGQDGTILVDGSTSSYRSVGDFMVALKMNKKISNVRLTSASLNSEEGAPDNQKISFAITAVLKMTKEPVVEETPVAGTENDTISTETNDTSTTTDSSDSTTSSSTDTSSPDTVTSYDSTLSPADAGTSTNAEGGL